MSSPPHPEAASANARSPQAETVQWRAEAARLLAAGALEGYGELLADAGQVADVHRRYLTRVTLINEGLGFASRASAPRTAAAALAAVAAGIINVLEEEPREPVLLNLAGVALYELWALDAAGALFRAARRLDPHLPFVDRNLAETARRRRVARRRRMPPLHPALPGLCARATRLAAQAKPAEGLTLSLCMIVRDEEVMLPRCLEAVAPVVDEIVIVDTGSRDRTVEIARSFGARVIEREWTGSFAEPRNVSFDAATGDWLLYLDADEVLVAEDASRLRALTGRTWREAFFLVEHNHVGELGDGTAVAQDTLRVLRNRPQYRFSGRIHEQILSRLPGYLPERLELTQIRIEHYGYLSAVRDAKEKSRRNVELLRRQQAEGEVTPFLHYNLGSECLAAGQPAEAVAEFDRALALLEPYGEQGRRQPFLPSMVLRRVQALRACGRRQEAMAAAREGLEWYPDFTDLVIEQAWLEGQAGNLAEASRLFERCLRMGDAPSAYMPTVGCGTYLAKAGMAELHFRRGERRQARRLLEETLDEHPGYSAALVPYAGVLLSLGLDGEAVADAVQERIGEIAPGTRFLLASVLARAGAASAAERHYRLTLAARPGSAHARTALAELLLAQRRHQEAAEEAAQVSAEDPFGALAARIELWGLLAAGEAERAEKALERARAAGVPAAELETFAAWRRLLTGEPAPALPVAGLPLLTVILESMLRSHDFERFEALLALYRESRLPPREQREALAGMYLRHGFLARAAREWMAVCREQPDARALLGLARVAAADGRRENAATFAAAALELDPDNGAAAELAARVQVSAPTAR